MKEQKTLKKISIELAGLELLGAILDLMEPFPDEVVYFVLKEIHEAVELLAGE